MSPVRDHGLPSVPNSHFATSFQIRESVPSDRTVPTPYPGWKEDLEGRFTRSTPPRSTRATGPDP